ncbi:carboxylic ester hydrolase [Heyndrickxia sporothermodurans]|nr:carboxylic ester hydrolase [Heyndrickxia sporothermodurans]
MKSLEVIFVAVLILSSIFFGFKQRGLTKNNIIILGINYIVLVATIIAIGANWRMIPAYIVTVIITLQVFVKPKNTMVSKNLFMKILKGVGIVLAAILMFTILKLFPIVTFPELTGKYTVGTQTFHLVDKKRKDWVEPNSRRNRELMVQVYYPAEKGTGKPSSYYENMGALSEQLSATQGLPHIVITHLGLTETHSYKNATPLKTKETFPLLLFVHGMGLYKNQNTFQLEELASQGYVVVALNITGDAATTVFPNGKRVDSTEIEYSNNSLDKHIKIWEQDASFVIDEVMKGDFDKNFKPIAKIINNDKIGMLGHSIGGATSTQMLVKDDRVKAAINMDGGLYGDPIPKNGPGKPFFLMNGETTIDFMKDANDQESKDLHELYLRNKVIGKPGVYTTIIPKANHSSFTDIASFSPIMNESGADVKAIYQLINEMVLGFFDKNLKGVNVKKLEEIQKTYPEINLIKH